MSAKVYILHTTPEMLNYILKRISRLPKDGQNQLYAIRNPKVKRQAMVSKVAKRLLLSLFSNWDVLPHEWGFSTNAYSKPLLNQDFSDTGLHFNISHCEYIFSIVISDSGEVGIDVESENFIIDRKLAELVFTKEELSLANEMTQREMQSYFIHLWTLKEAYSKFRGLGINFNFSRFNVLSNIAAISSSITYRNMCGKLFVWLHRQV